MLDPTLWLALDLLHQSSAVALVFFFLYHLLQIPSQAAITSWLIFRSCVCIVVAGGQKSKDSLATDSEAGQSVTTVHRIVIDLFVGNLISCT